MYEAIRHIMYNLTHSLSSADIGEYTCDVARTDFTATSTSALVTVNGQ